MEGQCGRLILFFKLCFLVNKGQSKLLPLTIKLSVIKLSSSLLNLSNAFHLWLYSVLALVKNNTVSNSWVISSCASVSVKYGFSFIFFFSAHHLLKHQSLKCKLTQPFGVGEMLPSMQTLQFFSQECAICCQTILCSKPHKSGWKPKPLMSEKNFSFRSLSSNNKPMVQHIILFTLFNYSHFFGSRYWIRTWTRCFV